MGKILIIGVMLLLISGIPPVDFVDANNGFQSYLTSMPPVYVSIVMHNEEPLTGQYPDFVNNEIMFWRHREAVVNFANMLYAEGVKLNYQSDWNFLLAATLYDNGSSSTNGKNFLRYLKEDLGFEIDPHAHETEYNYADVAYLIEALGVPVSHTVGGFLAYPPEQSKLEYFREPLAGWNYPEYSWQAEILWGGATFHHQNEEKLWVSGIWKPKDNENFLVHDENAPLPHIGGYRSNWQGLNKLLQKQQNGELEAGKIYTQTVFVGQNQVLHPEFVQSFHQQIQNLSEYTDAGLIHWVGLAELIDIWRMEYDSEPNIFPYIEFHVEIKKPKKECLYIFDREVMSTKGTIIIGGVTIETNVYSGYGVEKVEFYVDSKLKYTDTEPPYEWFWNEFAFGRHKISVAAYDRGGYMVEDEIDVAILNLGRIR